MKNLSFRTLQCFCCHALQKFLINFFYLNTVVVDAVSGLLQSRSFSSIFLYPVLLVRFESLAVVAVSQKDKGKEERETAKFRKMLKISNVPHTSNFGSCFKILVCCGISNLAVYDFNNCYCVSVLYDLIFGFYEIIFYFYNKFLHVFPNFLCP